MPHNHYHQNAERKSDEKIVSIKDRDVPSGKKCDCICTKCKEPLVAKKGKERVHHFAHANETNCKGETLAHIEAKNIIEKEGYLWLPRYIGEGDYDTAKVDFDEVLIEKKIKPSNNSADLWCTSQGRSIVVEIVVTHDLDEQKENFLVENKIDTLSIYVGKSLHKDEYNDLPENFSNLVLKESERHWNVNEKIDLAREEEKKARKREEKAEKERLEREEKIQIEKDKEECAKFLDSGGREYLEKLKIDEEKRDNQIKVLDKVLKEIKKRDNKKILYGTLVRADIKKYGGWKNALCVKSNILSARYDNLAFVKIGYQKYKDNVNENVGFKINYDTEFVEGLVMPFCKVVRNKKVNEKTYPKEESIDNRLKNYLESNKSRIEELSTYPGYSYSNIKSLIGERLEQNLRSSNITAYLNQLIRDAEKQND